MAPAEKQDFGAQDDALYEIACLICFMACPFFIPKQRCDSELWPHRHRLPLGDGWSGACAAGGTPAESGLHDCNLGYATECPHLPPERSADAIRFGASELEGSIRVFYICEREHRPGEHGTLDFDARSGHCSEPHPSASIQRMAECFLHSYLARRRGRS